MLNPFDTHEFVIICAGIILFGLIFFGINVVKDWWQKRSGEIVQYFNEADQEKAFKIRHFFLSLFFMTTLLTACYFIGPPNFFRKIMDLFGIFFAAQIIVYCVIRMYWQDNTTKNNSRTPWFQ